ncbi:uncharacterized protein LOC141812074 [Curcuma longa]|uniref:uncharacterized protein LOC141812074 n=1 Tax=Curcuma longa TaxID=136217 RepID=UPI003D9F3E8B
MAPKRAKVVRTTKKVVEETVEVLGVAVDSHNSVDLPAASDSKIVEVVVEAKEDEVPISVVVVAKEKKTEPETEQNQRAKERDNEASPETEEPLPQQKGEGDDGSKGKEAAESIADMETQEEEEGGEEREEKGEEDERVEKEAEPPTPRKVEQRKEVPVKESKKGGKRRKRRRRLGGGGMDSAGGGYKRYVFRVLKQVHPGLGISARAMAVVDGMIRDMFERLADEAARLSTYAGKATLSSREVQAAVQLVLPGELGRHAIAEGSKAVANYMAAASGDGH